MKGDAQVVPRGVLASLVREQVQQRRQEFLAATNNPVDLQIMGIEGRANVLREVAKGLDMKDDIVPSDEELRQRAEAAMMQQQQVVGEEEETEGESNAATN